MSNVIFALRIKNLRKSKNMSVKKLAETLHVSASRVAMWENAGAIPRTEVLIKISKFFTVTLDYLLMDVDNKEAVSENPKIVSILKKLVRLSDKDLDKTNQLIEIAFCK